MPMTTPADSLRYVESLGVHTVWEHVKERQAELVRLQDRLKDERRTRRQLEAMKSDVEMTLLESEQGAHREMSVAALERHMKGIYFHNSNVIEARNKLIELAAVIDTLEYEINAVEVDIRVSTARLTELGGLLQFMAVLKAAENPTPLKNPEDPW